MHSGHIQVETIMSAAGRHMPEISIGPVMPNWGSWEWLGEDLIPELSRWYRVVTYRHGQVPNGHVVLVIKHPLRSYELSGLPKTSRVLFFPVDYYGCASEIDADVMMFQRCSRIVVHCSRLRKYFAPYCRIEEMDHHIRFVSEHEIPLNRDGYILWVGARSNLGPLVEWVNSHRLPRRLVVLTNYEGRSRSVSAASFGFSAANNVEIDAWSHERHLERLGGAAAALDIKGEDFRQRHKPPTKAIDFIASGIPLAMNLDTSSVEHLAEMGFEVASAEDHAYWFSNEYADETRVFGRALRELLSRRRIAIRLRRIIDSVLEERLAIV